MVTTPFPGVILVFGVAFTAIMAFRRRTWRALALQAGNSNAYRGLRDVDRRAVRVGIAICLVGVLDLMVFFVRQVV